MPFCPEMLYANVHCLQLMAIFRIVLRTALQINKTLWILNTQLIVQLLVYILTTYVNDILPLGSLAPFTLKKIYALVFFEGG